MTQIDHNRYFSREAEQTPEQELRELHDIFGNGDKLHASHRVMPENLPPTDAVTWISERVAEAKLQGKYTALVAGGFDVPHDNHEWYIRDCRARVAKRVLEQNGIEPTSAAIMDMMTNGRIALIVSIDSDEALDARKGGQAEKGGIPRPVYPWSARAHRIAGYSFEHPVTGQVHHAADIISKECPVSCADTPLQSANSLISHLGSLDLLDSYIVFDEHPQDEINARNNGFDPIIVPQAVVYARDPRTDAGYKSSSIIKRIRGNL